MTASAGSAPTAQVTGIRSRYSPPSSSNNGTDRALPRASQMAISTAALANCAPAIDRSSKAAYGTDAGCVPADDERRDVRVDQRLDALDRLTAPPRAAGHDGLADALDPIT